MYNAFLAFQNQNSECKEILIQQTTLFLLINIAVNEKVPIYRDTLEPHQQAVCVFA